MRYSHRSTHFFQRVIEDVAATAMLLATSSAYFRKGLEALPEIIDEKHAAPGWPADYPDDEVLVFGDAHVGCPRVPREKLQETVCIINRANAEYKARTGKSLKAFFVGDAINTPEPHNGELVAPKLIGQTLRDLETETYAVMGDHDEVDDSEGVRRAYRDAGMKLLINESMLIENDGKPFWIAGLGEYFTERMDLTKTFAQVNKQAGDNYPVLVIGHRPDAFGEIPKDINMVMGFAGHAHGGQVLINGKPFLPCGVHKSMIHGMCENNGHPLYVTSGIGGTSLFWGSNVPPEIVRLKIASAAKPTLEAA